MYVSTCRSHPFTHGDSRSIAFAQLRQNYIFGSIYFYLFLKKEEKTFSHNKCHLCRKFIIVQISDKDALYMVNCSAF